MPCPLVSVTVTMCVVVVCGRRRPVPGRQEVSHAAARPLHRRHRLGVKAARLTDVGDALEMSDCSSEFFLRPQRTCLHVGGWQIAELHQVHLPDKTHNYPSISIVQCS